MVVLGSTFISTELMATGHPPNWGLIVQFNIVVPPPINAVILLVGLVGELIVPGPANFVHNPDSPGPTLFAANTVESILHKF